MKIGNIEVYGIIYKITNKVNGKAYIGQTIKGFDKRYNFKGEDIERVYGYHVSFRKNGYHYNSYLLRSIEKYGFDNFEVIKVFDIAFSEKELDIKEKHYIKLFDCINNGYNFSDGGDNNPMLNKHHTTETKQKISKIMIEKESAKGKNNPRAKSVICLTTKRIFYTAKEAGEYYKITNSDILKCCKKYKGKDNYAA